MSLLIFNPVNDFHCNYLIYKLKKRHIPFIELGSLHCNEYSFRDNQLIYNGKLIENVSSIYIRGNMLFTPTNLDAPYLDTYNEYISFKSQIENLRCWLKIMELNGVRMINPPEENAKYLQLYKLMNANLPIPKTCITNSYRELEIFMKSVGETLVYKPLTGGYFCRKFSKEDLLNMEASIFKEPVIFQEFIEGKDIRVYVLNGKVISAHEIQSNIKKSTVDYRTDPLFQNGHLNYKNINLPSKIQSLCIEAVKILGLEFSGLDFKLTSRGDFYLLECNSMPMYLDLEIKNGIKITDYIIDFLNYNHIEKEDTTFREAIYTNAKENPRDKENIFDYKKIYEDFYNQQRQKQQLVILPINKYQKKELRKYKRDINEEDGIIISIDHENNIKIIDFC